MATTQIKIWNGKIVPRIGIGTWVMGGEQYADGKPTGWSGVDDAESLRTLHTAFDMGVRIIDTADQYGAGHSEEMIARALSETHLDRDDFVLCTKVGILCDADTGNIIGVTDKESDISAAIDASLKRLGVDQIDLVKFHLNHHAIDQSEGVFRAFSNAFHAGKIAGFGWSNDDVEGAMVYADMEGYVAVQHDLNLFSPADDMLRACEAHGLWAFNRQPLAMGLLTGKYSKTSLGAGKNDVKGSGFDWLKYFEDDGTPSLQLLSLFDTVRDLLTSDGRSLAQGALGWCLAKSDRAIPLPGCRTVAQAKDNFGVLEHGPLSSEIVTQIDALLTQDS
ncbi:aldo/keto reductase [Cohaesibacter celericrescens]|nr:aldo/keto reductase [Cohaesibacter celericrescens]